jgi:lipopolysaccharide transport system permease protein
MPAALLVDVKEMLREQVEYRELLYQMTLRDLVLRYKQTVMGFGWAVFMPLINTAVFSVIFTRVAPIDVGVPYPLFAYSGLLVWNFFASSLRFSVTSLTGNTNLVTKIYFPREIFPFSAIVVCAVDFAVGSVVLIGLMAYYGVGTTATLLFLPIVVVVQVIFTAGIALLLAMANLYYRDVKYLFEAVVTIWMFATSVLYPTSLVTGKLGMVVRANPMTPILDAYRAVIFQNQLPTAGFYAAAAISLVVLALAWLLFHRAEFGFAENI